VPIYYRGQLLATHRLDFVVAGSMVLEIKSVERLAGVHRAQVLSYLRASALPIGLLVNFNEEVLKDGLKRFVI
jgi:GxxExxY protein